MSASAQTTIDFPLLGIDTVDAQHKVLADALERLKHWSNTGQEFAASLDAINALNDYVAQHFCFEEAFLKAHRYDKLEKHIEEHRRITTRLQELTAQVLAGGDTSRELIELMTDWIVQHIAKEDMEFAKELGFCS